MKAEEVPAHVVWIGVARRPRTEAGKPIGGRRWDEPRRQTTVRDIAEAIAVHPEGVLQESMRVAREPSLGGWSRADREPPTGQRIAIPGDAAAEPRAAAQMRGTLFATCRHSFGAKAHFLGTKMQASKISAISSAATADTSAGQISAK